MTFPSVLLVALTLLCFHAFGIDAFGVVPRTNNSPSSTSLKMLLDPMVTSAPTTATSNRSYLCSFGAIDSNDRIFSRRYESLATVHWIAFLVNIVIDGSDSRVQDADGGRIGRQEEKL